MSLTLLFLFFLFLSLFIIIFYIFLQKFQQFFVRSCLYLFDFLFYL
nr:MAG TPA: hypothetical protein [Caudoviricetes sp.]